jgi:hypothetical protein
LKNDFAAGTELVAEHYAKLLNMDDFDISVPVARPLLLTSRGKGAVIILPVRVTGTSPIQAISKLRHKRYKIRSQATSARYRQQLWWL